MCKHFHATDLYKCPSCGKKLRDFQAELRAKIDAIPQEIKQKILDGLRSGMNVGDAIEASGINEIESDSLVGLTIISDNIEKVHFLRTEAKE